MHPLLEPIVWPRVDDAVWWDAGEPGVCDGHAREEQFLGRVRITVEREQAARVEGISRKCPVHVLPIGIPVDLDRDPAHGGNRKHLLPVGGDTRPHVEAAAAWMPENVDK